MSAVTKVSRVCKTACPLLLQQQTCAVQLGMSAMGQKRRCEKRHLPMNEAAPPISPRDCFGRGRYQIIHAYKCNCGATRRYYNSTLVNGMVATMTHTSSSVLLSGIFVLGLTAGAHAQGTQQQFYPQRGYVAVAPSGSTSYATGVPTGAGPLSRPVGPAAGSWNRQWRQTYPMQRPFGSPY